MPQVKKEIKVINGIQKLRCSKCKYWYTLDEFSKNKMTSTGKASYCKYCQKSHYDDKRKVKSNTAIIGIFVFKCECCKNDFITKKSNKIYCSDKCRKRHWYERFEKGK